MATHHPPQTHAPVHNEIKPQENDHYINREMSWLAFNGRVLEEAALHQHPLLARMQYLAISANNLDEFFMKRIGGLHRQLGAGVTQRSLDGKTPEQQLQQLRPVLEKMVRAQDELLIEDLLPRLHAVDLHVHTWDELEPRHQDWLQDHFEKNIQPILTPLGVGPGQPFPFLSNLSLSLAVLVRAPGQRTPRFARVKIPSNRPRFIQIPGELVFVPLEEVIAQHLDRLFVGMEILESAPFRITRNADVERNEEEADDLLEAIEEELRNRRFAPIVRLETTTTISQELLTWLVAETGVQESYDVYKTRAPLGLKDLFQITSLDHPALQKEKFEPSAPVSHPRLKYLDSDDCDTDIFSIIRQGDLLVHHPYQSFNTSVLGMLQAAAKDPRVLAIKQTLYRTAHKSPIVAALLAATENGKEVNVQVEIKARFDEANNIEWVRTLERAGAHVTYGFIGLKTHSKTMLIVRDEPDGIRRYAHIGTGNYHTGTARLYTDLGLLTCDPELCQDVADLFNYLTGHSNFKNYRKLLVAPVNMRTRFIEMIRREITMHEQHGDGHIVVKMNQLEDPEIIENLYAASQAGVRVQAIVRGFCCLRPGVPGLSENITVMGIIDRFLEHSRIYKFHNHGQSEYYIGSADWMSRNLDYRVEAIAPIQDPSLQKELDFILETTLKDHRQAWDLQSDGTYVRRHPRRGNGCQRIFMQRALRQSK